MALPIKAAHLIGGELSYECLGNNNYRIELQIYRDCFCVDCADFDDPAFVTVFNQANQVVEVLELGLNLLTEVEEVEPNIDGLCLESVPDVCVERSTGYDVVVNLPPTAGGYKLVYQRCCRNQTITNIIDPGATGSTYELQIPDPGLAACNNSPTFNNFPPIIICANYPLIFDHSATDIDGDSLVYRLCTPYTGASQVDPQPQVASSPPYSEINWQFVFDENDQIGGSPPMAIDPVTGLLTGFPDQVGQFVVGVCVDEYRNGNLLSTSIRDFQFNISDCEITTAAVDSDEITPEGEFILNDCGSYEVTFDNESVGADNYYWDFGDPTTTSDNSTVENPTYLYPDTGVYEVLLVANPGLLCTDTAYITLNLYPLLIPDFSFVAGCSADPVQFTDLSTSDFGNITEWTWDFGDGSPFSTDQNPDHTYADGGTYTVSLSLNTDLGCREDVSLSVNIDPSPIPAAENTALCLDAQPIIFSDLSTLSAGNIVDWQWDFGDTNTATGPNPSHSYAGPGDYDIVLEVTSDEGCVSVFTQSVTIYEIIEADAGDPEQICFGESIQLFGDANVPADFEWTPSGTLNDATLQNPTASPNSSTNYTLTTTDPNGCTDTDQIFVTVEPAPNAEAGQDTDLCLGDSFQLNGFGSDPTGNINNISVEWSPNQDISDINILNPTVDPDVPTTYYLTVTELTNFCTWTDSVLVNVILPVSATVTPDTLVCEGSEIQLLAEGGDNYSWSPSAGLNNPSIADPVASPDVSTTYTVTVSNACFSDQASVFIDVLPLPDVEAGPEFDLNIGEIVQLDGNSEYNYNWTPPDGLSDVSIGNPDAQPLNTTTYYLTVISPNGCVNVDSTLVRVTKEFDIWVPNAFSPNADGQNDQIGITTRGIRDLLRFEIYNRWGRLVFETSDLDGKWDGTYKGVPQDLGAFVYYVRAVNWEDDIMEQKGNITLIR